jgi:hypothetical protein
VNSNDSLGLSSMPVGSTTGGLAGILIVGFFGAGFFPFAIANMCV